MSTRWKKENRWRERWWAVGDGRRGVEVRERGRGCVEDYESKRKRK